MLLASPIKPVSNQLLITAALCSFVLTWIHLISQNPFNLDGILYLHAAAVYLQQGFKAALTIYGWPFFSLFVAWLSQLTHLSLEHSAYLLNTGLQILIVINFILLTAQLGGTRWHCRLAALVILLYPYFNNLRAQIMRDFGYWAFALLALLWLLQYCQTKRWRYAIGWGLAMLIASLFRIEGLVLLFTAPLLLLFLADSSWRQRIRMTFISAFVPLVLTIVMLFWLQHHALTSGSFSGSRLTELFLEFKQGLQMIAANIQQHSELAKHYVLSIEAADNSQTFLIGGLMSLLLITFIHTLTPVYTALCGYGMVTQQFHTGRNNKTILIGFIIINLFILVGFLGQRLFVDKRYMVFIAMLCLLWLPATIAGLLNRLSHYQGYRNSKKYFILLSILALLGAAIGGIIPFGYSKSYITQAGKWLAINTPPNIKLYSNSPQVLYYAEKSQASWQVPVHAAAPIAPILNGHWRHYDYLAIKITHDGGITVQQIMHALKLKPIQTFTNMRQDQVLVFKAH